MAAAGRARHRPGRPGTVTQARPAVRVRGLPQDAGRPVRHPAAHGGGGRGQRDGRAHRAQGLRGPADHPGAAVLRAGRHLPAPRGQPDRPGEPARPAARGASSPGPTSGWPSTATRTAASSSTSAGEIVSPSVLTALIAVRELAREPGATVIHNLITSQAVPEIIAEHGGSAGAHPGRPLVHQGAGWPRPAPSSAASTPGTSTSATSGSPTPACWPRCTCWPRSAARTRRCRSCWPGTPGTSASGEINSEVADQAAATAQVRAEFAGRPGVSVDDLDGLTVTGDGLVVQPPAVEHRAAAAAQRRGGRRGHYAQAA